MKNSISLYLASLAISLSGYLGWRMWQPNLSGHWDIVEEQLDENYSSYDWIEALDITSDNVLHLNYKLDKPYPTGEVNRLFRHLYIDQGCFTMKVSYYLDDNKLHLEFPNYSDPAKPFRQTAVRSFKCGHFLRPEN